MKRNFQLNWNITLCGKEMNIMPGLPIFLQRKKYERIKADVIVRT